MAKETSKDQIKTATLCKRYCLFFSMLGILYGTHPLGSRQEKERKEKPKKHSIALNNQGNVGTIIKIASYTIRGYSMAMDFSLSKKEKG
ncbi:hypothetical protein CEXT_702781 [Caerostris extrusa]|uniref:Uncharacterized protein n=1 Tax=Caerostris extrusa TaxID=172846 RepID=A0AAV4Q836_CAEEX|nr:hypothetical protein CEXT_702781 [Caerostris extrusa]